MKVNLYTTDSELVLSYDTEHIPQKYEYVTVDGSTTVYKALVQPVNVVKQAGCIALQTSVNITVRPLTEDEKAEIFGKAVPSVPIDI